MIKTGRQKKPNLVVLSSRKMLSRILIPMVIPLLLLSCSDSSSGTDNRPGTIAPGSFEASVTGSESQTFSGISIFGIQQLGPPTGNIFVMTLSSISSNPSYTVSITFGGSNRPATGVHVIEDHSSDRTGQFVVLISQNEFRGYRSTSGSMTISQSSSQSLQGELTFDAVLFNDPDSKVTVTARFNANCQQVSIITCD